MLLNCIDIVHGLYRIRMDDALGRSSLVVLDKMRKPHSS